MNNIQGISQYSSLGGLPTFNTVGFMQPNSDVNFMHKDNESELSCILTYKPNRKLVETYINEKIFKYNLNNRFIIEKFVSILIRQRFKDNFFQVKFNTHEIILIKKINLFKIQNLNKFDADALPRKTCLIIYNIKIDSQADEVIVRLEAEPIFGNHIYIASKETSTTSTNYSSNSGTRSKKNDNFFTIGKIFNEHNFFNTICNYFKYYDKSIFDYVGCCSYLLKTALFSKITLSKKEKIDKVDLLQNSDSFLAQANEDLSKIKELV